jgi:phosphoadenosine phosphosulfate reductase
MENFLARHEKKALLLSAGKDSAACLKLLRPFLDQIVVVWVNPGNPYPETLEYMEGIRASVPMFVELSGNQPQFIKQFGYPVDLVPVSLPRESVQVVPFIACCRENLWKPPLEFFKKEGITGVIRGQKTIDDGRGQIMSGMVVDGLEYYHPVEHWSDEDVYRFLGDDVPPSYKRGIKTSLDCVNCTAYSRHNKERIADLALTDPSAYAEVQIVHNFVRAKAQEYLEIIQNG